MDRFIELKESSINKLGYPNIVKLEDGRLSYNTIPDYLYFVALEDIKFSFSKTYNYTGGVYYSYDCIAWEVLDLTKESGLIPKNSIVYIKIDSSSTSSMGTFHVTGKFSIGGSLKSLNSGSEKDKYSKLFENNTDLIDASSLVISEYGSGFYKGMFSGCTSLTKPPVFSKVNTLPKEACSEMFYNCNALKYVPALPFEVISSGSCQRMFQNCTSLIEIEELPAEEIGYESYKSMFEGCTSLIKGPSVIPLLKHYQALSGLERMFYGCTSLKEAPNIILNPVIGKDRISGQMCLRMFSGCTSLEKAPIFIPHTYGDPGTNRANYACAYMFENCISLKETPWLCTDLNSGSNMYCYNSMFSGCTSLTTVKLLSLTAPSADVTLNWLTSVPSNGVFIKNAEATWNVIGNYGIPEGWEIKQYDTITRITFIRFNINDAEYTADDNMTWESWVSSEYNTLGLVINDNGVVSNGQSTLKLNNIEVLSSDKVKCIAGSSYNI